MSSDGAVTGLCDLPPVLLVLRQGPVTVRSPESKQAGKALMSDRRLTTRLLSLRRSIPQVNGSDFIGNASDRSVRPPQADSRQLAAAVVIASNRSDTTPTQTFTSSACM